MSRELRPSAGLTGAELAVAFDVAVNRGENPLVGSFAVAGLALIGGTYQFAVAYFTPTGSPSPSFGTGGKVTFGFPSSTLNQATSVAIDGAGRIVVGGVAQVGGASRFALARLLFSGVLDREFSGDGMTTPNFSETSHEQVADLALGFNGVIAAVGPSSNNGTDAQFTTVARFTATGALADGFSDDGRLVRNSPAARYNVGQTVTFGANDRITVFGWLGERP